MKDYQIDFIDKVVNALSRWCPQMSAKVRYFVACQFALESNFGKSGIAIAKFNFCGMSVPKSRISLNCNYSGFAEYISFEDCVLDYIYWLCYNQFNYKDLFNLELFTKKLVAKKYCPEKDYIDRIYTLFNQLKNFKNGKR